MSWSSLLASPALASPALLAPDAHHGDADERDARPVVLDPRMREAFDLLTHVAPTSLPVLVLGETGAGKEGAAAWLHARSGRPASRFVRLDCASIGESVLDDELFGHERDPAASSSTVHGGLFDAANGGTLLLDEIGELGLRAQAKLLRVLESGEVGARRPRRIDLRVVATSQRDPAAMVRSGVLREDLYFRLDGATVTLPPLRRRPSEIVPLALLFLTRAARSMKRSSWILHPDAAAALLAHTWPGNVRELRNVIARAAAVCNEATLRAEHLSFGPRSLTSCASGEAPSPPPTEPAGMDDGTDVRGEIRAFERERILVALRKTGGNQTEAAKLLGVSRRTLTNKLNAHGLPRPRKGAAAVSGVAES